MKKIIIAIIGTVLFIGTLAGDNLKQLSDWSNAQAIGFNVWTLFCLIGIPYIIFLQFKKTSKIENTKKEKEYINFKKYFIQYAPFVVIAFLVIIIIFIANNGTKKTENANLDSLKYEATSTKEGSSNPDTFGREAVGNSEKDSMGDAKQAQNNIKKTIECNNLKSSIEQELYKERLQKNKNVILDRIFYSPSEDSCFYSYIIEDDNENRQCDLVGDMVHYDSFIIKDYLNNKFILRKTKGCNNYWFDNFEQDISLLKNN